MVVVRAVKRGFGLLLGCSWRLQKFKGSLLGGLLGFWTVSRAFARVFSPLCQGCQGVLDSC